jgi:mono/diheme cytochrome c family protein
MTIAVVGGVVWLAFLAVSALRSSRGKEEIAPNLAPARTDEELETRRLERFQKGSVILSAFMAVFLPLYFLGEGDRQQSFVAQFDEEAVARGEHIVTEFRCFDCHGPNGTGGTASYIDRRTGASVRWAVPSLNDVFFRHSASEVNFWVTYGRGNTPMPAWGLAGGGPLSEHQVQDVVAYLASIQITQAEVLGQIDGKVEAEINRLEDANESVEAALRAQRQLESDIERAPSISPDATTISHGARQTLTGAGEGIDTDGDGLSDTSEVAISADTVDFNSLYDLDGLVLRTYDPADAESTGAPDLETAQTDAASLADLSANVPVLEVPAAEIQAAIGLTGEDTDGDGLTDEAEADITTALQEAYRSVRPGNLQVVTLDPLNPESVPGQPDATTARDAVAAMESIALQLQVATTNQEKLEASAAASLAAMEELAASAAWEIDLQTIADSAFGGDLDAAERAVGLFNAYCARCHTSGWSEGVLYTQEAGAGALGPALWHGRELVQFQTAEQLTTFLINGSEAQKAYGINGFGSGRMPAFGMILSQEDIDLLVTYLRNGDLSGSEG